MSVYKRKQNPYSLQLIEEIKKHDCLWNTQKEVSGKGTTGRAWQAIAKNMDTKVNKAKAKWKNLKDTYRRELKKILTDKTYHGKWLYFDEMDFLRDVIDLAEILDKQEPEILEVNIEETSSQSLLSEENVSYLYIDKESPAKKRRRNDDNEDVPTLATTTTVSSKLEEEKYDEQFLVSLLPFMKRLEPVRKLMVRSKLQEALVAELNRNTK